MSRAACSCVIFGTRFRIGSKAFTASSVARGDGAEKAQAPWRDRRQRGLETAWRGSGAIEQPEKTIAKLRLADFRWQGTAAQTWLCHQTHQRGRFGVGGGVGVGVGRLGLTTVGGRDPSGRLVLRWSLSEPDREGTAPALYA
jgi:hypothetical protein